MPAHPGQGFGCSIVAADDLIGECRLRCGVDWQANFTIFLLVDIQGLEREGEMDVILEASFNEMLDLTDIRHGQIGETQRSKERYCAKLNYPGGAGGGGFS